MVSTVVPLRIVSPPDVFTLAARLGWRVEGRVLRRTIRGSRHLLREPPALAFDADTFQRLRPAFDIVEVLDREAGILYRIDAEDFDRFKERLDRGHGLQDFVRLQHWRREMAEGHQLALGLFAATAGS